MANRDATRKRRKRAAEEKDENAGNEEAADEAEQLEIDEQKEQQQQEQPKRGRAKATAKSRAKPKSKAKAKAKAAPKAKAKAKAAAKAKAKGSKATATEDPKVAKVKSKDGKASFARRYQSSKEPMASFWQALRDAFAAIVQPKIKFPGKFEDKWNVGGKRKIRIVKETLEAISCQFLLCPTFYTRVVPAWWLSMAPGPILEVLPAGVGRTAAWWRDLTVSCHCAHTRGEVSDK